MKEKTARDLESYIEALQGLVAEKETAGEKSPEKILASLGTLGGGNHFVEIDKDEKVNIT